MPFLIGKVPSKSSCPLGDSLMSLLHWGSQKQTQHSRFSAEQGGRITSLHLTVVLCLMQPTKLLAFFAAIYAGSSAMGSSQVLANLPHASAWALSRHHFWGRKGWRKRSSRGPCLWPTSGLMIETIYFMLHTWNYFKSCLHCTACGWTLFVQLSFCNLILQNVVLVCIGSPLRCSDIAERHRQLNPLQESVIQQI